MTTGPSPQAESQVSPLTLLSSKDVLISSTENGQKPPNAAVHYRPAKKAYFALAWLSATRP
jgi:hypothetical protein